MTLRIGSLFSGYGGLDMGVQAVLGGELAWHCQYDPEDRYQYAARILAHHWPEVPNLGDITRVCWACVIEQHGPVDVLTGGFPCTDLSLAGKRAGIAEGTRSGLWLHMARAIQVLRPRLVVIENVRGLLSQKADRGVDTRSEDLVRTGGAKLVLRALGAVLGDLAGLGFDAEWAGVQAAEVGAPHERFREFVLAWPRDAAADADDQGAQRAGQAGRPEERHTARPGCKLADAEGEGQQGDRVRRRAARSGAAAENADGAARGERRVAAPGQAEARGARADARGRGRASAAGRRGGAAAADADRSGRDAHERLIPEGQPDIEWGDYAAAVTRWESATGRPAPRPTDDQGRLSAEFVEWMMGLPAGHVTGVPSLPRSAQLKALGNGVVPLQAAVAVQHLLDRAQVQVTA